MLPRIRHAGPSVCPNLAVYCSADYLTCFFFTNDARRDQACPWFTPNTITLTSSGQSMTPYCS